MGFIFIAADWFGRTVVLSGEASRPASVTGPFDRESLNSVEQTFTVMVVSFMVAHAKIAKNAKESGLGSVLCGLGELCVKIPVLNPTT